MKSDYHYFFDISTEDGSVGQLPVAEEAFDAVLEHAHFLAIGRGLFPATMTVPESVKIAPVWEVEKGAPYVGEIAVELAEGSGPPGAEITLDASCPVECLRDHAQRASSQLVEDGALSEGDPFVYRVLAQPKEVCDADRSGSDPAFRVVSLAEPLPLIDGELARLREGAALEGEGLSADDYPVFVPRHCLERIEEQKREAGAVETGGLFLGHLFRDRESAELYAVITAHIHAEHTEAESMRLTFTEDTWTAARNAARLRRRGEIVLGWYHTHPSREWCSKCPPEQWASCPYSTEFFSAPDRDVHRSVCPKAYGIAFVSGDRPTPDDEWEDTRAVFGWRRASIVQRRFHVLENLEATLALPPVES